ncbi:MAG: glutaredoxin 3 [Myxococcaceae bacterium]|nr:glutaredoxin 3 [Myxococcaceae bacterium]
MKDIVIYTTDYCPWCRQAERFFTEHQLPFENIDVTGKDELRTRLVELSGGRKTVPQIFIGGTPIGGYSDLIALHQKGELMPLIQG